MIAYCSLKEWMLGVGEVLFLLRHYFKSLCNKDTVSNKTYQNFCDKRLIRPGVNTQIEDEPTSYKAKFSQSGNIYLLGHKYNIP